MSLCSQSLTSGFIDLATYDELEKAMYGGSDATAYFVRETRKSTWFTQVPVCLSKSCGQPGWNSNFSVNISRAGDYLLYTWIRVQLPSLSTANSTICVAWSGNVGHKLFREISITFNDLVAERMDDYCLDFWSAFTLPGSKRTGYDNMIGNVAAVVTPSQTIPAFVVNVPLPFFFSRDSGVALPTAALPYNEMRLNFSMRDWSELINVWKEGTVDGNAVHVCSGTVSVTDLNLGSVSEPSLTPGNVHVWGNYAIVSNDERKRMGCAPRDILMEQFQTAAQIPNQNQIVSMDIRFSHAIKVLFFAVQNLHCHGQLADYTIHVNDALNVIELPGIPACGAGLLTGAVHADPISEATLSYENTQRLAQLPADYYSLVQPFYHAPAIPLDGGSQFLPSVIGLHMYSYSLSFYCLDPMGSTNYGKLTNVSLTLTCPTVGGTTQFAATQTIVVVAVNNNVIRVSGGALGFPVL